MREREKGRRESKSEERVIVTTASSDNRSIDPCEFPQDRETIPTTLSACGSGNGDEKIPTERREKERVREREGEVERRDGGREKESESQSPSLRFFPSLRSLRRDSSLSLFLFPPSS